MFGAKCPDCGYGNPIFYGNYYCPRCKTVFSPEEWKQSSTHRTPQPAGPAFQPDAPAPTARPPSRPSTAPAGKSSPWASTAATAATASPARSLSSTAQRAPLTPPRYGSPVGCHVAVRTLVADGDDHSGPQAGQTPTDRRQRPPPRCSLGQWAVRLSAVSVTEHWGWLCAGR